MTDADFLKLIEQFLDCYPLSDTTFGLWSMNDSRFIFDLRRGRRCYAATRDRVCNFMCEYAKKQEAKKARKYGVAETTPCKADAD